jgi:hypothetical protein
VLLQPPVKSREHERSYQEDDDCDRGFHS